MKFLLGEDPPDPTFNEDCFKLYYNHDTANHLKKLETHTQQKKSFSGKINIKWLSLYVLFEKSIVDHFFVNRCLKTP